MTGRPRRGKVKRGRSASWSKKSPRFGPGARPGSEMYHPFTLDISSRRSSHHFGRTNRSSHGSRSSIWPLIEALGRDPDPSPESDQAALDPAGASINRTRGIALQAAVAYGLWCARHLGGATRAPGGEARHGARTCTRRSRRLRAVPPIPALPRSRVDRSAPPTHLLG